MYFVTRRSTAVRLAPLPGMLAAALAPGVARAGYTYVNIAAATPSGTTSSRAFGINDAGTVVGEYAPTATTYFTYTNGTVTPFPTGLADVNTVPGGGKPINASGNFITEGPADSSGRTFAVIYNPTAGTTTPIPFDTTYVGTAAGNPYGSTALSINASNYVVGTQSFDNTNHGFIYNPTTNTTTDIGGAVLSTTAHPVNATTGSSSVMGLSDNNLIVGQASNGTGTGNTTNFFTGFLGTPGTSGAYTYQDLTPLLSKLLGTGATLKSALPTDISENGTYIVGTYSESTSGVTQTRSFEITNTSSSVANDSIVDLGSLGGTSNTVAQAYSVNNSGQVVGASTSSTGTHAFLYSNGAIADLNNLVLPAPTGVTFVNAYGIDNNGDIVGSDSISGGNANNAFEVAATPEPTSFALLALGGVAVIGRRRRRPQTAA